MNMDLSFNSWDISIEKTLNTSKCAIFADSKFLVWGQEFGKDLPCLVRRIYDNENCRRVVWRNKMNNLRIFFSSNLYGQSLCLLAINLSWWKKVLSIRDFWLKSWWRWQQLETYIYLSRDIQEFSVNNNWRKNPLDMKNYPFYLSCSSLAAL